MDRMEEMNLPMPEDLLLMLPYGGLKAFGLPFEYKRF
jgi:hypothetical protein